MDILKNILRVELQKNAVLFVFKDNTAVKIIGNSKTGSGEIYFTGTKPKQSQKFIIELTNKVNQDNSMFWFTVVSLAHEYLDIIYEHEEVDN